MSNAVKEIIDDMVAAWVDHERTEDDDDRPDPDLEEAFRHDCERLLLASHQRPSTITPALDAAIQDEQP